MATRTVPLASGARRVPGVPARSGNTSERGNDSFPFPTFKGSGTGTTDALASRRQAPLGPLDPTTARREVLGYPAALLAELPLPTTLEIELAGGEAFTVATHPRCSARATWRPAEWIALVRAAEHERAYPHTLRMWLARKHAAPSWLLTEAEPLDLPVIPPPLGWSVERVLRQLGAVLRNVHIDGAES